MTLECPYCEKEIDDPDNCYEQCVDYEHECPHCEKMFVFQVERELGRWNGNYGEEMEQTEIEQLKSERDAAIWLLAEWCVDVDHNGSGWDAWDENYKEAMYRPGLLRDALDKAIAAVRARRGIERD